MRLEKKGIGQHQNESCKKIKYIRIQETGEN